MDEGAPCRVCGATARDLGQRRSKFSGEIFEFARCDYCGYTFVTQPRLDFARLYDADYYRGCGADPLTDYTGELAEPRSVRQHEWRGMLRIVDGLVGLDRATRWLDHGCGLGGAVRYARAHGFDGVYGFDEGYAGNVMRQEGVPSIERRDFGHLAGSFDVVTSIDVLEHVVDPVAVLREIRGLLRPGGVLFLTTGNAEPFRRRLLDWSYTSLPDVHVGFFEPRTVAEAYRAAGLLPTAGKYIPGFTEMLRYKILKNLRIRNRSWMEASIPWPAVCRIADRHRRLSQIPLAEAPGADGPRPTQPGT
jgi:SAM-dependent methyltransferase